MPDWGFVALYALVVGAVGAVIVGMAAKAMTSRRRLKFDPPPEN
jgi:hypothetical protein